MVNKDSRRILKTLTTIDSYDFSKFSLFISKIFTLIIENYIVRVGIIIFEFPNFNVSTKIYLYCSIIHNLYLELPPKIKILPLISKDRWLFQPICQVHSISDLHIEQQHHLDANHLFDICHQKRIHLLALK